MISVVVTSFEQARFLGEALESALAQTLPPAEILVVDDGSADDPREVVGRYAGVELIVQPHRGAAAARNRGLLETRGEFVVFLDADDRLLPHALETGLAAITESPGLAFVSGHSEVIDERGVRRRSTPPPCMETDAFAALLERCYIWCPASVLFRRAALDSVGGFREVPVADYDMYLRLARRFGARCHHRTVAEWRQHSANTSNDNAMMLRSLLAVLRDNQRFAAGNEAWRTSLRTGRRGVREYYGERALADLAALSRSPSRWWRAARLLPALVRHYPSGLVRRLAGGAAGRGARRST